MNIPTVLLYRAMKKSDIDNLPVIGHNSGAELGVRDDDIPVDDLGNVKPNNGGFSVTADDPDDLPDHRKPKNMGGTGKNPVFYIASNSLNNKLSFVMDTSLTAERNHSFIEPKIEMSMEDYRDEICKTRNDWKLYSRP